jgi:hypothetical protein
MFPARSSSVLSRRANFLYSLTPSSGGFPATSPCCAPKGYVVSYVAFHERGFSVPAGRFIRGVLFAYGLQLQHLNPNSIQQMAAFEAMCEGYLDIGAHWHLFQYFFRFTCLRDGSRMATIGCANLRMKQGRGDDYIPVMLTSSNSGWHKGLFYLQNDPEFALRRTPGPPSRSRKGIGRTTSPRRSRKRSSSTTGSCWGTSEEPESPWWR